MIKINKVKADHTKVPESLIMLLYGPPKSGKTTAASAWSANGLDGTLIFDTDLGTDFIEGANRIIVRYINPPLRVMVDDDGKEILDSNGFKMYEEIPLGERIFFDSAGNKMTAYSLSEIMDELDFNRDLFKDYQTIVIDTIDEINDWLERDAISTRKINAMGDAPFGADWSEVKKRMKKIIEFFKSYAKETGKTLILVSHSKQKIEEDKKTITITADLPTGLANTVAGMCDLIGFAYVDEKNRHKISFKGTTSQQFGSRLVQVAGKILDLGYSFFKEEIEKFKKGEK